MFTRTPLARALACALLLTPALPAAADPAELVELKTTIVKLIDALVEQGVLDADKAAALVAEAEASGKAAAQVEAADDAQVAATAPGAAGEGTEDAVPNDVVRVTYVPDIVKEEIRNEVRAELRREVTEDVVAVAKAERWGTKDALPDWVSRLTWSGEFRLRSQSDFFASGNAATLFDFNAINDAGGVAAAGPDVFLNTREDEHILRARMRLALEAKVNDTVTVATRLSTGEVDNPVSANTTFRNNNPPFETFFDRAWLRYEPRSRDGMKWLTLRAGRLDNPWLSTNSEITWDRDFKFDGVAGTLRYGFRDDGLSYRDPNERYLFLTAGVFPIDEIELSSADKWLLGAQAGGLWTFDNQSSIALAAAWYDYTHIRGRRNQPGSDFHDFTAPDYMQRGNTLFDIADPADPAKNLLALAADYDILHVNFLADWAILAPIHIGLEGDVVRNFGYDEQDVLARAGSPLALTSGESDARVMGYALGLNLGWPEINKFGDWFLHWHYTYLQRDAVLDAFTGSNPNRGGTNHRGWVIAAQYGLGTNTWLQARWFSVDEIDGPPLGTDRLQVDLNARF
ncbi:MAG: putative porin [Gammaproteobacteria bacterium]